MRRILVLDKNSSGAQTPANIHVCKYPDEALSVLMGASSAFGDQGYSQTGKIRPDVLVIDESFLETYEGFELLEIMRKYYTLRDVSILVASSQPDSLDPAIRSRYKIAGTIAKPYDMATLLDDKSASIENSAIGGPTLAGLFAFAQDQLVSLVAKVSELKSFLFSGLKGAILNNSALGISSAALVLGTAISVGQVTESERIHSKKHFPKMSAIKLAPAVKDSLASEKMAEMAEEQQIDVKPANEQPEREAQPPSPSVQLTQNDVSPARQPRTFRIIAVPDTAQID